MFILKVFVAIIWVYCAATVWKVVKRYDIDLQFIGSLGFPFVLFILIKFT